MRPFSALTVRQRSASVFALSGFAVAQPLLDLLARQADFLVARHATPSETLLLTVALILGPALVCIVPIVAAGMVSTGLAGLVHLTVFWGLGFLTSLPPLLRLTDLSDFLVVLSGLFLSALATGLFVRVAFFRSMLGVLAVAPFAFAALFLSNGDVRGILFQSETVGEAGAGTREGRSDGPPVVMLVFDALPLSSLLDMSGQIDSRDYPSFARLAKTATWFPNAYATSSHTTVALPILLTGRYPGERYQTALYSNYPENLFSILAPGYELNVLESQTMLHVDSSSSEHLGQRDLRSLASDLSILYTHIVLPQMLRRGAPEISRVWGHFAARRSKRSSVGAPEVRAQNAEQHAQLRKKSQRNPVDDLHAFRDRMVEVSANASGGVLHFAHAVFPHSPWNHLHDGTRYTLSNDYMKDEYRWVGDPWWPYDAYRRHLLQVGFADKILGEFLDTLERIGAYDDALIIVCADHGESFWPGHFTREPYVGPHLEDIVSVPLLVKFPGQRSGRVDARIAESVDILPTIIDVVGAKTSTILDGCSLARSDCPKRGGSVTYKPVRGHLERVEIPADVASRDETLQRKGTLFPEGMHHPNFYGFGKFRSLVGRKVSAFEQVPRSAGVLDFHDEISEQLLSKKGGVPARIVGIYRPHHDETIVPQIAIVTGGVIQSIVPAVEDPDGLRVAAILPTWSLEHDIKSFDVMQIDGTIERPMLSPIEFE